MSKVKVEIRDGTESFFTVHVDGKKVCTSSKVSNLAALKILFEKVFDAMNIENVEVIQK